MLQELERLRYGSPGFATATFGDSVQNSWKHKDVVFIRAKASVLVLPAMPTKPGVHILPALPF